MMCRLLNLMDGNVVFPMFLSSVPRQAVSPSMVKTFPESIAEQVLETLHADDSEHFFSFLGRVRNEGHFVQ